MLLCAVPFAAMSVHPTTATTENRRLSEFPSLTKKEGGLNLNFFSQFEKYFGEHFAFRNELVAADGMIQGKLFGVSSVKNVIHGSDGWLYYTSTLPDYLGENAMSERELAALGHNLSLVNDWLKERNTAFVFTVPANKNTLYGSHMPYYAAKKVSEDHTLYHIGQICAQAGITYADLYEAFHAQTEVLYLKRDSHWNNKGAVLACDTILDAAGHAHESFAHAPAVRKKEEDGDLNRMVYSYYGEKEVNYYYDIPQRYTYVTDTASVEDGWIETACEGQSGSLLMFRDSFGNTLLPLVADSFGHAWFTKESPYRLEKTVTEQMPSLVIFEKVERNLRDFITAPPILSAPQFQENIPVEEGTPDSSASVKIEENMFDPNFWQLSGTIDPKRVQTDTEIVIAIDGMYYKTYDIGSNGFMAYLRKDQYPDSAMSWEILLKENGVLKRIARCDDGGMQQ